MQDVDLDVAAGELVTLRQNLIGLSGAQRAVVVEIFPGRIFSSVIIKKFRLNPRQQVEEAAEVVQVRVADDDHIEDISANFPHSGSHPVTAAERACIDQRTAGAGLMQDHRITLADIENLNRHIRIAAPGGCRGK